MKKHKLKVDFQLSTVASFLVSEGYDFEYYQAGDQYNFVVDVSEDESAQKDFETFLTIFQLEPIKD